MNFVDKYVSEKLFGGRDSSDEIASLKDRVNQMEKDFDNFDADMLEAKNEVLFAIAGSDLKKGDVLCYDPHQENIAIKASSDNVATKNIAGICLLDTTTGSEVKMQKDGEFIFDDYILEKNQNYFLSINGNISKNAPDSGFIFKLGNAKSQNTLVLDFGSPILY